MNATTSVDVRTLATVTVSFNPDIALLETQLRALPAPCTKFIVDNASRPELVAQIEALASRVENVRVLRNDSNIGLAAAVNRGVDAASELAAPPRFVLLLDQDSEPQPGSVESLIAAFEALEHAGEKVGCVGPLLRDPDTGLTHGFHQCTRWRWKRVYPPIGSTAPVPCANLNGSGTLVPVSLFRQLHGLDEPLFIDHVDTEWAFRVLASGYTLWGIPSAVFVHRMGQSSVRFWWFGWRVWPSRSPQRHYFLARNAIVLMGSDYVPTVWKIWASVKLFIVLVVHLAFDRRRFEQAQGLISGIRNGLHARKRHRPARL
ncbi:MAG: dTDP-rhamnosyl transferase RfbF [Rhodanobacteraceae bacterium]|jgi:rhamnosyltransferase|nr:MAG: dTDP-rhamnosyl transferase RfbF [Rhodanobacteraceae bacterium]